MQDKKQSTMAGNLDVSICNSTTKSVPRNFSWIENYKLITWHGNCLLAGFGFSIKILLVTITLLFWILLCYLLNMTLFCIGSISWCCFVVPLLFSCSTIPWYSDCPASIRLYVPPVFRCSASVPVFRRCSAFRSSVFRCSWFYSMPLIIQVLYKKRCLHKSHRKTLWLKAQRQIWDILQGVSYLGV